MDTIRKWLETISKALNNGSSIALTIEPSTAREFVFDERQKVLAQGALENLPLPMRTLLKALDNLKCDMTRDQCDLEDAVEAKNVAMMESAVAFVAETLHILKDEIDGHFKASLDLIEDPNLVASVEACIGQASRALWIEGLEKRLASERLKAFESARAFTTTSAIERPLRRINIEPFLEAVEASVAMRGRLKDLSSGSLQSLSRPKEIHAETPLEEPVLEGLHIKKSEKTSSVNEIMTLIRRVRRSFDSAKRRQCVAIDDAISAAAQCISEHARALRNDSSQYAPRSALVQADASLQEEIKLLLKTLSVDRPSLDQYLRSIKASCESIRALNARESAMSLAVKMQRWQSLLLEAFEAYTQAQQY